MIVTKTKKILLMIFAVVLVGGIVLYSDVQADTGEMQVSFFDVGQGDAELIQTPFGQNILVDGGPD